MPGSSPRELVEAALKDLQSAIVALSNASSVLQDYRQLFMDSTANAIQAIQAVIEAHGRFRTAMIPAPLPTQ